MAESKIKDIRTRNFATVLYDDSMPTNWKDIISDWHVPVFVAYHDRDINPDGSNKKPHYHVMIMFEGKKSDSQVNEMLESLNAVGLERINTIRGYARYLCHLDNPEKYQYSTESVIAFSGADYQSIIGLPTDKYKAIREMIAFCQENYITAYSDLLEYASTNRFDWFKVLCDSGTVVMKEYLKSVTWKTREYADPETGEIK